MFSIVQEFQWIQLVFFYLHVPCLCFLFLHKKEKKKFVFFFAEQEFAKSIMKTAEGAKTNVLQQVWFTGYLTKTVPMIAKVHHNGLLIMVPRTETVAFPFLRLWRFSFFALVYAGNDAITVHLHTGSRTRHQKLSER